MKKIPSLFKRDYEGTRLVYDEVVPGCEWVVEGEGIATVKWDGTACMVRDGVLFKRYDRKLTKGGRRRKAQGKTPVESDFKPMPEGWEACEPEPDVRSGHWPGWVPVGDGPEDKWHREAWKHEAAIRDGDVPADGTYELLGSKVQGNPYNLAGHVLVRHGGLEEKVVPRFQTLRNFFELERNRRVEGIVWHHPDGRMCKIKCRDFGLPWPPKIGKDTQD